MCRRLPGRGLAGGLDPAALCLRVLAAPAVLGGAAGAVLLLVTPHKVFDAIVPLLVLVATALLLVQNLRSPNGEASGVDAPREHRDFHARPVLAAALQFAVAVYGGSFGAGMGSSCSRSSRSSCRATSTG